MGAATLFVLVVWTIGLCLLAVHPVVSVVWCVGWWCAFHRRPDWWRKQQP